MSQSPRHIRIFLSSPGDVEQERQLALEVIEQLQYHPLIRGQITVEVVAWDKKGAGTPMLASLTPQEAINQGLPKPSECDVVIVIFWSRMGTPLPPEYEKPEAYRFAADSEIPDWRYLSGTEWEYIDGVKQARRTKSLPFVTVYRRTEDPPISMRDPDRDERIRQWERVEAFFASFVNADGSIRQGYNAYTTPDQFRADLETHLHVLVKRLLEIPVQSTNATAKTAAPPPLWHGSPFPGLRAFMPEDAPIFFGRGRETDALIDQVRGSRFVAVVGASGSGKSSLVGAGLLPRLDANAIPGSKDWRVVSFTPGGASGNPFQALADALVSTFPALIPSPLEAKRLKDEFVATLEADPSALIDTCAAALAGEPDWAEVLLFVDQFEELFTVVDQEQRAPFAELLAAVAASKRVRAVVTMRADFFHRCVEWPELNALINQNTYTLSRPGIGALHEMITRPAARAGLEFADGLPERILADTGDEPGALALMAYTLDELYHACTNEGGCILSHEAYEDLGGVTRAIGTRAENAFKDLPGDEADNERTLQRVFHALVEVDERGTATRRRASKARLLEIDGAAQMIDHFASGDVRLLVTSGDDEHTAEVEVAHEALLREWDRLANWIEATQDDRRLIRRIERDAREWDRRGKPDHMLPNAEEITEFQAALARFGETITDDVVAAFTEPEQDRLLRELDHIDTPHARRSAIGERLCAIGDPRPGVGLRPDGLPDIVWCAVPGGEVKIKGQIFTVEPFYIAKYPITFVQFQAFLDDPQGFDHDAWWEGLTERYRKQNMNEQRYKFASNPRDSVSWYQAVAFTRWLDAKLKALTPWPPLPQGEGEMWHKSPGERDKFREMARQTMVNIARDLRQRQTNAETVLWNCLRNRRLGNIKFRRQHPVAETTYVADFFSYEANLIVELDGPIHDNQRDDDLERQQHLEHLGYHVVRFTNDQVFNDLETVLSTILEIHYALSLLPEGEGPGMRAGWAIRLPTEWEWQQAATGGDPANEYPWGPDWDGRRANTSEAGIARTTVVGVYPHGAAPVGALDMSGNVWEWCLNEYEKPGNIALGGEAARVLRGGAFYRDLNYARSAYRDGLSPRYGSGSRGFRVCVSRPPS